MARIRTIKPEFFSHEQLASKSAHARLLAIGLLTLADCEGRLRWVPMQVHAQVFPWEAEVKIEVLLGEVLECGYAVHYEVAGKRYVEICNFKVHQRLSGKEAGYKSRLPPPPIELQKPNDLPIESGEAIGKHPYTSLGSVRNPLGTGEHRNIGTGEQRSNVTRVLVTTDERGSTASGDSGFVFSMQVGPWHLPEKKLAEYVATYKFDVRAELLKASQWLRDNKERRPRSGSGVAKFLTRWLNRKDDGMKPSQKLSGKIKTDDSLRCEMERAKKIREDRKRNGQLPDLSRIESLARET